MKENNKGDNLCEQKLHLKKEPKPPIARNAACLKNNGQAIREKAFKKTASLIAVMAVPKERVARVKWKVEKVLRKKKGSMKGVEQCYEP